MVWSIDWDGIDWYGLWLVWALWFWVPKARKRSNERADGRSELWTSLACYPQRCRLVAQGNLSDLGAFNPLHTRISVLVSVAYMYNVNHPSLTRQCLLVTPSSLQNQRNPMPQTRLTNRMTRDKSIATNSIPMTHPRQSTATSHCRCPAKALANLSSPSYTVV